MITKEQIKKHCGNYSNSGLLYAKLDRDYQAKYLDYILPVGTIVQVRLYKQRIGDSYLNGIHVDYEFPYDAATLLETDE